MHFHSLTKPLYFEATLSLDIYRPQTKFAKVMFLHLSVILFTRGGGSTGAGTSLRAGTPPWTGTHPQQVHPPWEGTSPLGRYTPLPGAGIPHPGAVHAGRYGQQAGGTHPTGMHSRFTTHSHTI